MAGSEPRPAPKEQAKMKKQTAKQIAEQGTEANGYVPAAQIHQEGMKGGGCPLRLVIYRSERDFGTFAAAKVVGADAGAAAGALLRMAAAAEELGQQVNIDRDRVGNRMFWIEDGNWRQQKAGSKWRPRRNTAAANAARKSSATR
jgi:hypothetical protein